MQSNQSMSSASITEIAIAPRALVVVLKYYRRRFPPRKCILVFPIHHRAPIIPLSTMPFGPVWCVHIPKDNEVQDTNGFAFNFQQHEHAVAAWKLREPFIGCVGLSVSLGYSDTVRNRKWNKRKVERDRGKRRLFETGCGFG